MSEERSWPELQAAYARGELVDEPLLLMLLEPPQTDAAHQPPITPPADDTPGRAPDAERRRDELLDSQRGEGAVDPH